MISHVAIVFDSRIAKSGDNISSYHEFYRFVPTKTVNPKNIKLDCTVPITVNHLLTKVTAKINDKQYTLSSVAGLQVGDAIVFNYDVKPIKDKVVSISGNNVTIETGSSNISVNQNVSQLLTYIHIISGGTSTANSGNTIAIIPFNQIKVNAVQLLFSVFIK
jgi:hypothetical protein